ncbi:MAG: abortive infection family protein [Planctomycetes bacterium]|nr:abortive infection family protein [Planctomycetota bacterium]
MTTAARQDAAPLTDAIIVALSKLVDDAQADSYREPSHSEIQVQINRAGLSSADPNQQGQTLGKAKRVRAVLHWAIENDAKAGGKFVFSLLGHIRGCGGFRPDSPNYAGDAVIRGAVDAFSTEGFVLGVDGVLSRKVLEGLVGAELTEALEGYVRRAKKGVADAALLTGTSKDLLEATAAHVLVSRYGGYSSRNNFPTLLGQAFVALGMSVPNDAKDDTPINRLDRGLFEAACAINTLRNKQGTGHGRPWVPTVSDALARTAVETIGLVAERMLNVLRGTN